MRQSYLWPNLEHVVLADLDRLHHRTGPWSAIFFTGDAVQRGADAEFDQFNGIRERLLDAARSWGSDPAFLAVPGNHDLARPDRHSGPVSLADQWSSNADLREDFWSNSRNDLRQGVDRAFRSWTHWFESLPPDPRVQRRSGVLPGDFSATVQLEDLRLGVIGLNTSFLQLRDGDRLGRLSIDPRQLAAICPDGAPAWSSAHDLAVLLTHHPPEWLDTDGQATLRNEIAPPGRFSAHLYGHQHEPRMTVLSQAGGHARCEILGRSLFGLETWGESTKVVRLHGYSVGEFTLTTDDHQIRVWPREGRQLQGGGWQMVPDYSNQLLEDGGTRPLPVGTAQSGPTASAVHSGSGHRDLVSSGQTDGGRMQSMAPAVFVENECLDVLRMLKRLALSKRQERAPRLLALETAIVASARTCNGARAAILQYRGNGNLRSDGEYIGWPEPPEIPLSSDRGRAIVDMMRRPRAVFVSDPDTEPTSEPLLLAYDQTAFPSFAVIPIMAEAHWLGILEVATPIRGGVRPDDVARLTVLANVYACGAVLASTTAQLRTRTVSHALSQI
jgi:hypothetical protein